MVHMWHSILSAVAKAECMFGPPLLTACLSQIARGDDVRTQPNIVLIFIDDLGYDDLSCYGNTDIKTPHIDRLAGGVVRLQGVG